MDISFKTDEGRFNYRVCAIMTYNGNILTMRDDRAPCRHLPGGRVQMGETAEEALVREVREELAVTPEIIRPLWLNQAFFTEEVLNVRFHELCVYFLTDISKTDLLSKGERFTLSEGEHVNEFEWLRFEQIKDEYFYPIFLKEAIFDLPQNFTIRTEYE